MINNEIQEDKKLHNKHSNKYAIFILLIILIGGVLYFVNFNNFNDKIKNLFVKINQQIKNKNNDKNNIVNEVGKLIILPTDDVPKIIELKQVEELVKSGQKFFSNAHNGDKLIIYPKTQKAIIYNEKNNILVNVGPIILNKKKVQKNILIDFNNVKVSVLDGGGQEKLRKSLVELMKKNKAQVVDGEAKNKDYKGITVFYSKNFENHAQVIKNTLQNSFTVSMEENKDVTEEHNVNIVIVVGS